MLFAKRVYLIAGIYGLIALLPQYLLEAQTGRDYPPAITHPEYFYGFVGVGVAWQLAFLIMSTDPVRYRPLMPATFVEKLSFGVAVYVLYVLGRVPLMMVGAASIDLLLCALFVISYVKTAQSGRSTGA